MAGRTVVLDDALSCNVELTHDETRLAFSGEITEDSNLKPLLKDLAKTVRIDLSKVSRLTSCGIREWVDFVHACEDAGAGVALERCSPFVVTQLSAIANFAGRGGRVRSLFAPYVCYSCRYDHLELVEVSAPTLPELNCPKCKRPMELEDVPEVYEAILAEYA